MWLLVLILLIAVFIDMALSSNRVGNDLPRDKFCFRAERFKILNVMRRVEAFAMPSFPPVRNFFVLRVFPRERETFSPRMAKLAVKHLVGDVSFLQDNANRELARFVLLVVLVLASSSWSRTSTNDWVHGPDARFWSRRGSP